MSAIIEFVKEAQGYLFQSDDVSKHLIEAIGERASLAQQVRAAQENYDMLEGGYIFMETPKYSEKLFDLVSTDEQEPVNTRVTNC